MKNKTCIIVSGATAVGKTAYGIELARKYNTQIISADSRQCFKELNIGVAKPSAAQLADIDHYFISSHSIHDDLNVKVFEEYALKAIREIFVCNDVAIMVGGTGLYIKAFCEGIDEVPPVNESIRNEIIKAYRENGIDWLNIELRKYDPGYFDQNKTSNPQRMMRSLEVKLSTGKSLSDFQSGEKAIRDFKIENVNLEIPRDELYKRINARVDVMMEEDLLKESESLYPHRELNALQTVGYRELFDYMDGKISLDRAIDLIKQNTRHFAKRQITWFKGHPLTN